MRITHSTRHPHAITLQNTIFSSIVASFIIEMYKTLQPSPNRTSSEPFKPPTIAIRMNIVMFLSLFLSMMSVLACALIQQWCREFMKYAYPRAPPHKCGRVRTYLFQGLDQFQMRRFMYGIHVFLHVSVFLFFWAVSDFLYSVYAPVGTVARYSLLGSLIVYTALSISPLIFSNSPYHTALTPPLRSSGLLLLFFFRTIWRFLRNSAEQPLMQRRYFKGIRVDRTHFLLDEADKQAKQLDCYALQWLFTEDDFTDIDMDKFLEGLPGYLNSQFTEKKHLIKVLTAGSILTRIREHFIMCTTSSELTEEACVNRVSACVNSLRLIFKTSRECPPDSDSEKRCSHRGYIQGIVDDLNTQCDAEDSMVALRACCVRSLAFQGLLSRLTQSDGETPKREFPVHLVPVYTFFCLRGQLEGRQQPEHGVPSAEAPHQLPMNNSEMMWKSLLHDGSLVNLTILAKAVLSHDSASPSSLSLCWRTLDILLKELMIARTEVSESTLAFFKEVHNETRDRVQAEERGFLVTKLLEILDTAARGRHVSMVLLHHPEYHSRADVVYGKEHLRNSDLLIAFATCLPDFVAKNSEKDSMTFMEDLVNHDSLWTTLQVNLWNSLRSDNPIPDKLRVFEACCTVLDVALLVLEDSPKVDWRAPEFGSLAQHFEISITQCLQSTFIGRATGFRIGLIKARYCKALLAQFFDELNRKGTIFFRSQWDVASLARLFCILEVGDEEDVEFWKCYIDGGHIGDEFKIKAREMLEMAVRDGPLLIFCKLGYLATMAGPLDGSDVDHADIEELWKLQRKMMTDAQFPLNGASREVWWELERLRDEVIEIRSKSTGGDEDKLRQLLEMIDEAYNLRPSGAQEHGPSDHAEAQIHETWAAVQPELSPRVPSGARNRYSFASLSSTITAGRSDAAPTSESGFGGTTY
jgi:Family of unknown function (DUF6535)